MEFQEELSQLWRNVWAKSNGIRKAEYKAEKGSGTLEDIDKAINEYLSVRSEYIKVYLDGKHIAIPQYMAFLPR